MVLTRRLSLYSMAAGVVLAAATAILHFHSYQRAYQVSLPIGSTALCGVGIVYGKFIPSIKRVGPMGFTPPVLHSIDVPPYGENISVSYLTIGYPFRSTPAYSVVCIPLWIIMAATLFVGCIPWVFYRRVTRNAETLLAKIQPDSPSSP